MRCWEGAAQLRSSIFLRRFYRMVDSPAWARRRLSFVGVSVLPFPLRSKRWCLLLAARGGCRQWRRYAAASCSRSTARWRGELVRERLEVGRKQKRRPISLFLKLCGVELRSGVCRTRLAGCSPSLLDVVGLARTKGIAAGWVLSGLVWVFC